MKKKETPRPDVDFIMTDFIEPDNQPMRVARIGHHYDEEVVDDVARILPEKPKKTS